MVILDSSVVIDHLRRMQNRKTVLMQVEEQFGEENLGLSVITVQELYRGLSTQSKRKERDMLSIISPFSIFPYSYEVAKLGGIITRDHFSVIELADAAIAATAIINKSGLATLNTKDFKVIKGLDLIDLS